MSKLTKFQAVAIENSASIKGGLGGYNSCTPAPTYCAPKPTYCAPPAPTYCAPPPPPPVYCAPKPVVCAPIFSFSFNFCAPKISFGCGW